MFHLEEAVNQWRRTLLRSGHLTPEAADELECHLRECISELSSHMLTEEEAFLVSGFRLGDPNILANEFRKNRKPGKNMLPAASPGPELAQQPHEPAALSRRFTASMFDVCILVLLEMLAIGLANSLQPAWAVLGVVSLKLLLAAYLIGMTCRYGGTLGKQLTGIRICSLDGSAITLSQGFLRSTPFLVLTLFQLVFYTQYIAGVFVVGTSQSYLWFWLLVLAGGSGWLLLSVVMLIKSQSGQAIHDATAGTLVVEASDFPSESATGRLHSSDAPLLA